MGIAVNYHTIQRCFNTTEMIAPVPVLNPEEYIYIYIYIYETAQYVGDPSPHSTDYMRTTEPEACIYDADK